MPRTAVQPLWGSLSLERDSGQSLQDQIVDFFRAAVAGGRIQAGQRLPSSRQLASECDVSRTTAVEVYQRLVAEGYFVTRPGAGVFVADTPPEKFGRAALGAAQPVPVQVGPAPSVPVQSAVPERAIAPDPAASPRVASVAPDIFADGRNTA